MTLILRTINPKIEQNLRDYIRNLNNGYLRKGATSQTVEEAIEFFLENPEMVEIFRKKKKEELKKILKASLS